MKHHVSPRQGERLDLRSWKQRLGVVSLVAAAGVFLLAAQPLPAVVHAGVTGQSTSGFTTATKDVDPEDAIEDVTPDQDDDPTPSPTPTASKQLQVDRAVPLSVPSPTVPHTGSSAGLTVVLGVLLVAIGAGLLLIRRLARRDP